MKKKLLSMILLLVIICSSYVPVFADQIIENPNVKVVIDCKPGTYTSAPIVVNNRTLLPLRELLINLGVPNDAEHIIWNAADKSVIRRWKHDIICSERCKK